MESVSADCEFETEFSTLEDCKAGSNRLDASAISWCLRRSTAAMSEKGTFLNLGSRIVAAGYPFETHLRG